MAKQNSTRDGVREQKSPEGKTTYQARIRLKGFPDAAKIFSTRTAAKKWRVKRLAQLRENRGGIAEAEQHTLAEAIT